MKREPQGYHKGQTVYYVQHLKGHFPEVEIYTFQWHSTGKGSRKGYAWMTGGQYGDTLNPVKNLYDNEIDAVEECMRRCDVRISKWTMHKIKMIAKLGKLVKADSV